MVPLPPFLKKKKSVMNGSTVGTHLTKVGQMFMQRTIRDLLTTLPLAVSKEVKNERGPI